jgi:hypothetical protein
MNRFYLYVIAFLILIILFLSMCNGPKILPQASPIVKIDTVFKTVIDSSSWMHPEPKTVTLWHHDTLEITNTVERVVPTKVDTLAILKDYFAKRYYEDTIRNAYGYIIIKDTITENKVAARKHSERFTIPVVTTTIQLPVKQKTQVYAGILAQGSKDNLLSGFGVGLMLKTKKDQVYQLAALQNINGGQLYQASTFFKISFRNH